MRPDGHDEKKPCLGVFRRLPHLVPLEVVVFDALAVDRHAVDCDGTLPLSEELCGGGQVGEEEEGNDAGGYRERPEDKEDVHPPREARRDVAHGVANQPMLLV